MCIYFAIGDDQLDLSHLIRYVVIDYYFQNQVYVTDKNFCQFAHKKRHTISSTKVLRANVTWWSMKAKVNKIKLRSRQKFEEIHEENNRLINL